MRNTSSEINTIIHEANGKLMATLNLRLDNTKDTI
jgi:hypothetical protein